MRKETGILIAGSVGLILGFGIFGVRRFLLRKSKAYNDYYSDFHRHFERKQPDGGKHDIEYLAML